MNAHQGNWLTTLLPFAVIILVVALRLRSMRGERPLKVDTLWVVPVMILAVASWTFWVLPPPPIGWALAGAGLAIGAALGWYRGGLIHIERNAETGKLTQRASPLAMILLVAIIALKLGARAIFGETAAAQPGSSAMLLTDAFIGFALGLLSATRLEMYLRAKRLLSAV